LLVTVCVVEDRVTGTLDAGQLVTRPDKKGLPARRMGHLLYLRPVQPAIGVRKTDPVLVKDLQRKTTLSVSLERIVFAMKLPGSIRQPHDPGNRSGLVFLECSIRLLHEADLAAIGAMSPDGCRV